MHRVSGAFPLSVPVVSNSTICGRPLNLRGACERFASLKVSTPARTPRYQNNEGVDEMMDFKLEPDMHSFQKARRLGLDVSPAAANIDIPVFYAEGLEVRVVRLGFYPEAVARCFFPGRCGSNGSPEPHSFAAGVFAEIVR